jgi:hypothetical protein
VKLGAAPAAEQRLPEQDELTWDDGTANPEPALDDFQLVSSGSALRMLGAGLAGFAALGLYCSASDKKSRIPFTPRQTFHDPRDGARA